MSRTITVGRSVAAVVVAAALAVSGLATTSAQASGDRSATTSVRVVKHRIHMPSTVRAGLHTFRVRSKNADFQLLTVHGGYTKAQFVRDTNQGLDAGNVRAIRRLERHVTFLGGAEAAAGRPADLQVRVPRGTFWAVDTAPTKAQASRIFVGHAVGPAKAGQPTGTATLTAVDPDRWSPSDAQTIAPSGRLLFRNASGDNHFVVFGKLLPGKTVADFGAWVNAVNANPKTAGDPPIDQQAPGFFNGVESPGHTSSVDYAVPAGSYVVACFWPDADMGGQPHAFMGMYRGLTVQ